jgi:hypothetical protein
MGPVGMADCMGKKSNPVFEISGVKIVPAGDHKPVFDKIRKERF